MHSTHNPSPITRNPAAEKFSFSAKERDTETGLSYFGARYYSSDLSLWLSVDPMSGKYPSLSPYVYCADNPVRCVDPNGEEVEIVGDPPSKCLKRFNDFFNKKIRMPLMKMVADGASDDDLEAAAVNLSNKYQKKLLKGGRNITGWERKGGIEIKVFNETEKIVNVKSRPDNQEMIVCGEIEIELIDATNIGFGNANIRDVQKQPYIIIVGRDTVKNLKAEAKKMANIESDNETMYQSTDFAQTEVEIDGDDEGKALYIYVYEKKDEQFDQVIDVNVKGVFNCTQAVVPVMVAGGEGRIINTASVTGVFGNVVQDGDDIVELLPFN